MVRIGLSQRLSFLSGPSEAVESRSRQNDRQSHPEQRCTSLKLVTPVFVHSLPELMQSLARGVSGSRARPWSGLDGRLGGKLTAPPRTWLESTLSVAGTSESRASPCGQLRGGASGRRAARAGTPTGCLLETRTAALEAVGSVPTAAAVVSESTVRPVAEPQLAVRARRTSRGSGVHRGTKASKECRLPYCSGLTR